VLAALIFVCLFILGNGAMQILLSAFLLMGAWEWSGFAFAKRSSLRFLCTACMAACAIFIYLYLDSIAASDLLLLAALVWWFVAAIWMFRYGASAGILFTLVAGLLVLLPALFVVLVLLDLPRGEWLLIWVVAIVAAADIGAFAAGKKFGQRKLAPMLSPGKTWEGLYGGLVAAIIVGGSGAALLGFPPLLFAAVAGLIAPLSVVGDLTVSAFKRHAGLKDSGFILPGHGGVLDRIDGLVAALPLFLLALRWVPGA
jgi:phosphatidate cytidylyltransferase